MTPQESLIIEETIPQRRRIDGETSLHRFWRPLNEDEFEHPEADQVEAVISASSNSLHKPAPTKVIDPQKFSKFSKASLSRIINLNSSTFPFWFQWRS